MAAIRFLSDLFHLFYPNCCACCGRVLTKEEETLCLICTNALPKTNFHQIKNNPVEMLFAGKILVEKATAFCFFRKGGHVQTLMHLLKYKNRKDIGFTLGYLFGKDLSNDNIFSSVDVIIPIPIHHKKQKKRGYNQSEQIVCGLSESMNKPFDFTSLVRTKNTETQTRKTRYSRWENVADIFAVRNSQNLENKHILLVDDIVTTGSTLEAATNCLLQVKNTRVSIACLACAVN